MTHSPDSVVLDGVVVPDRQGEVIPPGLRVSDQEGAVFILTIIIIIIIIILIIIIIT